MSHEHTSFFQAAGRCTRLAGARAFAVLLAMLVTQAAPGAQQPVSPKGTLERITVHGRALEGNLERDSPDRQVVVYLPPSYATARARQYPVLYFLHGYTATAEAYVKSLAVPDSIDRAVAAGAREMIVVIPDAFTKYSGSMFSNSPTTGDWETFIARDLTAFIDGRYRTLASREGRGLAGHSMGGYGTMRIGMKQPAAFAALYAMSSCCLMNDPAARGAGPGPRGAQPHGVPVPDAATDVEPPRAAAAEWPTRCRRRRPPGHQMRRPRPSSICPPRTERSSRSSPQSGLPTRRS